jgi:hypothetical protein
VAQTAITIEVDGDRLVLDEESANLLYEELWDVAFTSQSRCAVAAAVRMRSFYKLQPIRTIRFTGEEAEAVRRALALVEAAHPVHREARAAEPGRRLLADF